jgi:N-acetylneuraminic acid mutarotase
MGTARKLFAGALGGDGRIYAIGGVTTAFTALSSVEAYNTSTTLWSPRASLNTARFDFGAATGLDGRIYAIGGFNSADVVIGSVECYTSNTWTFVASMPTPRRNIAVVTGSNGLIYAIGGATGGDVSSTTNIVEAYNPSTGSWITRASMNTARYYPAAALGPDGRIYVFGGTDSSLTRLNSVECYSPTANKWAPVAAFLSWVGSVRGARLWPP